MTKKVRKSTIRRASFTINEFCERNSVSRSTYYALKADGLGPDEARVKGLIRISREAEKAWLAIAQPPLADPEKRHKRSRE